MDPVTIFQVLTGIAALANQVGPLVLQLKAAMESGDDAQVDALLKRLQVANDALGVVA